MCNPMAAFQVASIFLTVGAGVQQASAQRKQGEYVQKVEEENAKIRDLQAAQATQIGNIEEERKRRQVRAALGTQRASFAASGVDMSSGSALEILGDTAALGEQDALAIRSNALREAWGFRVGAMNNRAQGALARTSGRNAAIGTLLSTGAQAAGQFGQMRGGFSRASTTSAPASFGGFGSGFGSGAVRAGGR